MAAACAYTDGCCKGNPGPGGWGFAVFHGDEYSGTPAHVETSAVHSEWGGNCLTTNNKMELTAAISALKWVLEKVFESTMSPSRLTVFSDSTYVVNGINKWIAGWKVRGWVTANWQVVKNADLWQELDKLRASIAALGVAVKFVWVKAHADNVGNNFADLLSNRFVTAAS